MKMIKQIKQNVDSIPSVINAWGTLQYAVLISWRRQKTLYAFMQYTVSV